MHQLADSGIQQESHECFVTLMQKNLFSSELYCVNRNCLSGFINYVPSIR